MIVAVLCGLAAALVAAGLVAVYARHHRSRVDLGDSDLLDVEPAPAADGQPVTLETAVATIRNLADRVTLAEAFNRRLNAIVNVVLATVGVVALVVLLLVGVVFVVRQELDRRETDRVERTVAACLQDNQTAAHINAGNSAKRSIVDALAALQHDELDGILGPIVANPTSPQAQAFADHYQAGRSAVEKALDEARAAIAAADVPTRVCTPAAIASSVSSSS